MAVQHSGLFGEWDQDVAKSTFSPGPAPTSSTRKYEQTGQGFKVTVDEVRGGKQVSWNYTAPAYDGKDYPVHGRPDVDTVASYQLDSQQTLGIFKKNGVEGGAYKREVSSDGKTLTVIAAGADDGTGKPYFDVTVYTKK